MGAIDSMHSKGDLMNMLQRVLLCALVVASFAQPAFSASKTVEFQLDNSSDYTAYEETIPAGEVPQAPAPGVQPAAKPMKPAAKKPAKAQAEPKPMPREIPLIETKNEVVASPDVRYITGGIGEDEARQIIASKSDYNLHIMSADATAAFVGDAHVVIARKDGKVAETVLDVVSGPLLYVALPPGEYGLSATLGEQHKEQTFSIKPKGAARAIHLGWKSSRR
jgi:hypothetical protein